jgi:hypothetical protein
MSWAFGTNEYGREIGYGVQATCDFPGCDEKIDRGLGYACGGMHDSGPTRCGGYFCGRHLYRGCRGGHGLRPQQRHWQRRGPAGG